MIKQCSYPPVKLKEGLNRKVVKEKKITINEHTINFSLHLQEEIRIQSELAKQYPDIVLGASLLIKSNQEYFAEITYDCTRDCTPILDYTKTLVGEEGKKKKLEICCQLINICTWMQKNQISHRNIKPTNIFYYQGKVLLSDFGSQRTFYLNYCGFPENMDQNIWRINCLFYCCGEILNIIKQNTDSDLTAQDMIDWAAVQNLQSAIFNDIWVIGIIILEIILPTKDILQVPLEDYYGLNEQKLQEKLQSIEKETNPKFSNSIKKLLSKEMFYLNIEEIYNQILESQNLQQLNNLQQININLPNNQSQELVLLPQRTQLQQYVIFHNLNSLNQQSVKINLSIIDFTKIQQEASIINFSQHQSQILEESQKIQINKNQKKQSFSYTITNEEKRAKEETYYCINKLRSLLLKNIAIDNFNKSYPPHKIKRLLKYDHLIWMNEQEIDKYEENLKSYQRELEVSKHGASQVTQNLIETHQEMIKNALFQLQWRRNALKLLNMDSPTDRSLDQFLFYLNDEEFTKLAQNKQVYEKIDLKYRKQKRELTNAITKYQCYGLQTFELDQLGNLSMTIIQNSNDELLIDSYQKKEELRNDLGIEWLDFNKPMYFTWVCDEFIKTGDEIYRLKSKARLDLLPNDLQQKYKNQLQQKIAENLPEKQEVFETALFLIEEDEPFQPEFRRQFKNEVILHNRNVSQFIVRFLSIFIKDFSFKKDNENKVYFRDLKSKEFNNNIQQQYKNSKFNCYYNGRVINDIPNGFGYSLLDENILFIGIFRNNKLFKGWSIIKKRKMLSGQCIYFSKGKFVNGLMEGKGIQRKYEIVTNDGQTQYILVKESKGYFKNDKLHNQSVQDCPSQKIKYNKENNNKNEYFEGKFFKGQLQYGKKKIGINGNWIEVQPDPPCQLI